MSGKTFFVILTLLSITFAACSVNEAVAEEQSYSSLLARVKNFDRSVDFTALRLAYAGTPEYDPLDKYGGAQAAMFDALKNKQYETALKHVQSILDKNYVDIDVHLVCKYIYGEMNNPEKRDFHQFVAKGLIDSILNSGDGKSLETAYLVINKDEQTIILAVLGLREKTQSAKKSNGRIYEVIEAIDRETGKTSLLYFDVDIPIKRLTNNMKK